MNKFTADKVNLFIISMYSLCVQQIHNKSNKWSLGLSLLQQGKKRLVLQSGPKKLYPDFNFGITSVNVHRF